MNNGFKMLFYLKKPKKYTTGPIPIYLRISVDEKRSEVTIGEEVEPYLWDNKRLSVKGTNDSAKKINRRIETVAFQVIEIRNNLSSTEEEITSQNIKDMYLGKMIKPKMLFEIYVNHNNEMESLIGNGFSENTLKTFRCSLKHLRSYVRLKYRQSDIGIRNIDYTFIKGFDFYLRTKYKKCSPVSSDKYVKHLKKIVLLSIGHKWLRENPFLLYKFTAKPTPRTFLTYGEIVAIANKKFSIDRLKHVRDVFIFCCYTGLSYIDIRKLSQSEIGIGDDNKKWIFTKRHKTNLPVHLPILPIPLAIIKKYRNHLYCKEKATLLPIYTNQRMNSYLKEIADVCKITKRLTFHMARHSFATTIALGNGVPIETVSKMLGHSSIKTTQHYAKVLDSKTSYDMAILEQQLKIKKKTL